MVANDSKWKWDVFLSHSSRDKSLVRPLAERLEKEGYRIWYDEWSLVPGTPWQEALEDGLARSAHCAVFVGPNAFGPWHSEEMRQAVEQYVSGHDSRVIPVLLPGVPAETRKNLPKVLKRLTWVEFKELDDQHAFRRLLAGLEGRAPRERGVEPKVSESRSPVACPSWAAAVDNDQYGQRAMVRVRNVSFNMRFIPKGRFTMGSPTDEKGRYPDEGPQHEVTLTKDFWLAETPCTQALWVAIMGKNPSNTKGLEYPVDQVSWNDCRVFFKALNENVPELVASFVTEAQWEYTCRAGTTQARYGRLSDVAWYSGNASRREGLLAIFDDGKVHCVGERQPNAWGLYDMLGNVNEWCSDWHGSYTAESATNPTGPDTGTSRVARGGWFNGLGSSARSANREYFMPGRRPLAVGLSLIHI